MISSRILLYCIWVSKKKILIGNWEYEIKKAVCVLPGTVDGKNHGKQVGRRERLDRMGKLCYFWWREVHVHVVNFKSVKFSSLFDQYIDFIELESNNVSLLFVNAG